jgi:hypothetical protein
VFACACTRPGPPGVTRSARSCGVSGSCSRLGSPIRSPALFGIPALATQITPLVPVSMEQPMGREPRSPGPFRPRPGIERPP